MTNKFFETLQKYGTPEKSNMVLGLNFTGRFSYDEQDRLVDVLSDINTKKITVRQFYKAFGIKPEEANIVRRIREVDKDKNPFEWVLIWSSLPIRATGSIDDFLAYEVPQEVLDFTQERIQRIKSGLLDEYNRLYHNPEIPNTVGRLARKARNELYDFGVFISSLGTMTVLRESEEDAYRRALGEQYHASRKRIEENTPQIAETMLATFFKFEDDSNTVRKVDKKFMSKVYERGLRQLGIKYVIQIDYNDIVNSISL